VRAFITLLALGGLQLAPLAAQSTPYVPSADPAYQDLDVLVAAGLVTELIAGERPYSRAAFARFLTEARGRIEPGTEDRWSARLNEALERLGRRFVVGPAQPLPRRRPRLRGASLVLTGADSPYRELRPGRRLDRLDGFLNPLLDRSQGRRLADGASASGEAVVDLYAGPLAGRVAPRLSLLSAMDGTNGRSDVTLVEAYARAVIGPVGIDIGRNRVSMGYGSDGGPALSHNARGLDMIRLSADRPVRLPGFLGALGLWQASGLLADMGKSRDIPGSKLAVFRLSSRPNRFVEFGVISMNHLGGEGAPEATWRQRINDLVFFLWAYPNSVNVSNKAAGVDLRVTLPSLRTELYVNGLTTDDRGHFTQPAGGRWEDAIWLIGARASALGEGGRFDFWGEWKHAGADAHTHGQFTSGLTLDDKVIGDALGPNASSVQGGLDWTGTASRISFGGYWERYSGDDFGVGPVEGVGHDWTTLV